MLRDFDSCGACSASEIIARKWVPVIVCQLLQAPKRYNELRRAVPQISSKVLSENLASLEKEGIVARKAKVSSPIAVSYQLSPKGEDLVGVIQAMNGWGEKWLRPIIIRSLDVKSR